MSLPIHPEPSCFAPRASIAFRSGLTWLLVFSQVAVEAVRIGRAAANAAASFPSDSAPMPLPATGKQVTVSGITLVRLAFGKAVEVWSQGDTLGFLQQLGVIPAPDQAS